MGVAPKKLDLHDGDVVEIEGRRYDVVPDGHGGLTLKPARGQTRERIRKIVERHRETFDELAK